MANTGKKIYSWLVEVDVLTGIPTGRRKPNIVGDPDYVPPVQDLVMCPVQSWSPIDPVCVLNEHGLRTGMKKYLRRELKVNSTQLAVEDNVETGGAGPYFPPVEDFAMCEPQFLELFDFVVLRYRWTDQAGKDLDTISGFIQTGTAFDGQWVGYGHLRTIPNTAPYYIRWGGDNTNSGVEAILINFKDFAANNPTLQVIKLQLKAHWWNPRFTGDIELELQTYLGGSMVQNGFDFVNQGGTVVQTVTLQRNVATQLAKTDPSTYDDMAYLTYDVAKKIANITNS